MDKRCGAKARTNGHQTCKRYAMANGRCHLHGGIWTGAKTEEGKLRQKMGSWKHGRHSKEAREERKSIQMMIKETKQMLWDSL